MDNLAANVGRNIITDGDKGAARTDPLVTCVCSASKTLPTVTDLLRLYSCASTSGTRSTVKWNHTDLHTADIHFCAYLPF